MGILLDRLNISKDIYSKSEIDSKINSINEELENKADKATTLAGYGITDALGHTNITNCIVSIPQNIKYEISSDNTLLTIKAGSLIYNPDGSSFTLEADVVASNIAQYNTIRILCVNNVSKTQVVNIDNSVLYSGSQPVISSGSQQNYYYWYDFMNGSLKSSTDKGITWNDAGLSLPVARVMIENNKITKVTPFNCLGFFGRAVFCTPGLIVAVPNGRNEDGSLNNTITANTSILTNGNEDDFEHRTQVWCGNAGIIMAQPDAYKYIEADNRNVAVNYDNDPRNWVYVGNIKNDGNRIIDFEPRSVFRAIDYSDYKSLHGLDLEGKELITLLSSPSVRYDNLQLQATEATYIAPGNGYFTICKTTDVANEFIWMRNETTMLSMNNYTPTAQHKIRLFLPARKGDNVTIGYSAAGELSYFRFVYLEGDE